MSDWLFWVWVTHKYDLWPVRPVHTSFALLASSEDPLSQTLEHFWGFNLGHNGGYVGFNYWWPRARRWPRIRFAAMWWIS